MYVGFMELTDGILYRIEHTKDESLKEAQQIIHRIKTRQLYKCLGTCLLKPSELRTAYPAAVKPIFNLNTQNDSNNDNNDENDDNDDQEKDTKDSENENPNLQTQTQTQTQTQICVETGKILTRKLSEKGEKNVKRKLHYRMLESLIHRDIVDIVNASLVFRIFLQRGFLWLCVCVCVCVCSICVLLCF